MEWSMTLGTVSGIKIKLHLTFLLLIPWAAYNWGWGAQQGGSGALFGIALTVMLFLCVVLHELAHSLVARHYGVAVREIELLPIGGVSKMESMPEKPSEEFVMALAGPLVNLVIAIPLAGAVVVMILGGYIRSLNHLVYLFDKPSWQGLILNLLISNVMLAFFNLLPAFPMDGGRVLRSVLALRLGQRRATHIAARVGQFLAILLGLIGLLTPNWVLVFIALFVFTGAQQEERLSEILATLGDLRVGQAMITACEPLTPDETLQSVLEHALRGHPACYGVLQNEQLVGILTHADITSALETYDHDVRVRDVMRHEFPQVTTEDTLAKAWRLMATSGWRALPVVQDGKLMGMVTVQQIGEIYAFLAAKQRGQRHL